MRFEEKTINSISELIAFLRSDALADDITWYRGQADIDWQLKPSLIRKEESLQREKMLIKRFKQTASPYLTEGIPASDWDWIFLMQHYRVPTRLLDWTESPLVALYFAINSPETADKDAVMWCLDPIQLNREARLKFDYDFELPAFGTDKILDSYLPERLADNISEMFPIAAIGQRNSKRMLAQSGTFTIHHLKQSPIDEIGERKHIWRYRIPKDSKAGIIEELNCLGYSKLKLFPELDSAGEHVAKELER